MTTKRQDAIVLRVEGDGAGADGVNTGTKTTYKATNKQSMKRFMPKFRLKKMSLPNN